MKNIINILFTILILIAFDMPSAAQDLYQNNPNTNNGKADVIIRKDGIVIRAKVLEVGISVVKYRRADQLDGPVYTMYRSVIYAISYGDNTKDYLLPIDSMQFYTPENTRRAIPRKNRINQNKPGLFSGQGEAHAGLGFFRQFSRADKIDGNFARKKGYLPAILAGYSIEIKPNLQLGAQLGIAGYTYEGGEFREFDQLVIQNNIKENITSLNIYGRYIFASDTAGTRLRPYIMAGLSINSSKINSQRTLNVLENGQNLLINSTSQSTSMGMFFRAGSKYILNDKFSLYADLGNGISILQMGGVYRIK